MCLRSLRWAKTAIFTVLRSVDYYFCFIVMYAMSSIASSCWSQILCHHLLLQIVKVLELLSFHHKSCTVFQGEEEISGCCGGYLWQVRS